MQLSVDSQRENSIGKYRCNNLGVDLILGTFPCILQTPLPRSLPCDLVAPISFIDPRRRQAEYPKFVAEWTENPKRHTAQTQAREKKRAQEATKHKKREPRWKKRSADEPFGGGENPVPKTEVTSQPNHYSEPLPFLANVGDSEFGFEVEGLDI